MPLSARSRAMNRIRLGRAPACGGPITTGLGRTTALAAGLTERIQAAVRCEGTAMHAARSSSWRSAPCAAPLRS